MDGSQVSDWKSALRENLHGDYSMKIPEQKLTKMWRWLRTLLLRRFVRLERRIKLGACC
jgi:hypothetical protein